MTKKNNANKAQVESVNVVANNANVEAQTQEAPKAEVAKKPGDDLKARAEALVAEAKKLKEEARQAAKEAKEAAKKAKALTSRPIRKFYFETRVDGEFMMKSDVHYCAEKAAIDALTEARSQEETTTHIYEIIKVTKENKEAELFIEKLYLNDEKQIVIE